MPYYDFECLECGERFTVQHGINAPHPTGCTACNGSIRQIYHPPAALYKGSGFFATDNKEDTRVRSASGVLGRRVSETDASNIDEETPTQVGDNGRPKMTPTRPLPKTIRTQLKPRDVDEKKLKGGITRRTSVF